MSIETHCPTCLKSYNVADEQRGKRVRCKHCNDNFLVKDDLSSGRSPDRIGSRDDDRSARKSRHSSSDRSGSRGRRRGREYDDEDGPGSGGSNSDTSMLRVVLVIGVVLALPIIAGVVIMVVFVTTVASKIPNMPLPGKPPIVLPPNPRPDPNAIIPQPQPQPPGVGVPRTIDLMALIDPAQDTIHGRWTLANRILQCPEGNLVPRIQIPYQPPPEYDFVVEFSQPDLRNGISLIMPRPNGGSFFWYLGSNGGGTYGFGSNPNKEGFAPGLIEVNKRYTTTVQVRRDGVRGLVNGKELMNLRTNLQDLTADDWRAIRDTRLLAVACDDPTTFYTIQLVEMAGNGKRTR